MWQVFLLCLLGGCSICWFNTVCFVVCIRNFPVNRPLALSLTVSYNGVSAALYTLAANSINPSSDAVYLLLNALVPLLTSFAALVPILRQPPLEPLHLDTSRKNSLIFLILNFLAIFTGLYLLIFGSSTSNASTARLYFGGAILLLISPLCIPGIIYARDWFHHAVHSNLQVESTGFILVHVDDLELHKELLTRQNSTVSNGEGHNLLTDNRSMLRGKGSGLCCEGLLGQDQLAMLGEDHSAAMLVASKFYFARTGWLTIALIPTPIAFIVLAASESAVALYIGTALIGLSSGFIFAASVSVTSELFGPNSFSVNHNILITNIPIGSLLYGFLSAVVYDANAHSVPGNMMSNTLVCMGRNCYLWTFVLWACISVLGLASSVLLFLRTKHAYDCFERHRISAQSTLS
ncbi:putative major facilitator superfamily domain-containing protein [Lupinus albus]|uniref:Putative major facilitator superfamily domain-containing protein n=1 Tax=Lupinus albus TaxID=3870 RepID=A0A6A4PZI8_LUPAL|nr:putative major facilitator superfamily domain-containing protein [Lupinus albus]